MLVEKRISTKLNYDVLRDIEIDSGHQQSTLNHAQSSDEPTGNQAELTGSIGRAMPATSGDLTITRTPLQPRLPSLTSRKRDFSSLGGLSPFASRSPHPLSLSARFVDAPSAKRTKVNPAANSLKELDQAVLSLVESSDSGSCDPDVMVESGPVKYCDAEEEEEGEGLDDEEMEELIYEDDPLLAHSDTEDYDGDY